MMLTIEILAVNNCRYVHVILTLPSVNDAYNRDKGGLQIIDMYM